MLKGCPHLQKRVQLGEEGGAQLGREDRHVEGAIEEEVDGQREGVEDREEAMEEMNVTDLAPALVRLWQELEEVDL